jgi:hypothetical protein
MPYIDVEMRHMAAQLTISRPSAMVETQLDCDRIGLVLH